MGDKIKIQVFTRNVYGRFLIYPFCDGAKKLVGLFHKETFNPDEIVKLKEIGFEIEVVPDPKGKV